MGAITGFEQDGLDIVMRVDGRTQSRNPSPLTNYYAYVRRRSSTTSPTTLLL
jgi:hypothetical protein